MSIELADDGTMDTVLRGQQSAEDAYDAWIDALRDMDVVETPDKVAYNDSGLDIGALDAMLRGED